MFPNGFGYGNYGSNADNHVQNNGGNDLGSNSQGKSVGYVYGHYPTVPCAPGRATPLHIRPDDGSSSIDYASPAS
eukprot:3970749-Karenia_brevis.AAC.1